jgi:putative lipoic acid-binding regulatory protein
VTRALPLAVGLLLALVLGARAQETVQITEAAELVLQQLAALRAHDFAGAYALASREMQRHFSRGEFEWMVKRTQPEIASSAYAFVVRTHESGGYLYVTVKVHGKNGKDVEALYEVVREGETLRVNAVSSRGDEGVL